MRTPFPTAPAFAIAGFGMLVQERTDWNIYGGNIASTLAGEYSFEIALALSLFALGALAYSLDTGKRRWLPPVLIALAVMSHIVVAIFVGVAAMLLWLVRRPRRTWPLAVAMGVVGLLLTAVWTLPLLGQQAYTQSMRYAKVFSTGSFQLPHWVFLPNPVKHTIEGIVRGVSPRRGGSGEVISPTLWLPWWIWVLAGVAIVAAGWYRRRSTLVVLLIAGCFGVFFVQWPEHAVWNTRFLPFWLLMWGFLAATGAAEIVRLVARAAAGAYAWIGTGDLEDQRARAWADIALDERDDVSPELRRRAVAVLAERQFDDDPPGWEPPHHLESRVLARRARAIGGITLAVLVGVACTFGMRFAWTARNGNPSIRVAGWAEYNYNGYQELPAWPEFRTLIDTMNGLAPGRALWEGGDAVGVYGTTLSPELLPYFTDGRIGSMEGLYFESSATVPFHFMTVSELAKKPSNPVRGLVYGSGASETDFALGVKHLQMLGVTYLLVFSDQAEEHGGRAARPRARGVGARPRRRGTRRAGRSTRSRRPTAAIRSSRVCRTSRSSRRPTPGTTRSVGASPGTRTRPCRSWVRGSARPRRGSSTVPSTRCGRRMVPRTGSASTSRNSPIRTRPGSSPRRSPTSNRAPTRSRSTCRRPASRCWCARRTSRTGRCTEQRVRTASRPNFMVVVPTANDVKLTYGLTKYEWLGRFGTLLGIAGVGLLIAWKGAERFAALARGRSHARRW